MCASTNSTFAMPWLLASRRDFASCASVMSMPTTRPDLARGEEAVHAGAAPEVDGRLTLLDVGKVEVVADASEGVDRFGRDRVELVGGIAETFGERAPRLEVELLERLLGHLPVHLLDAEIGRASC